MKGRRGENRGGEGRGWGGGSRGDKRGGAIGLEGVVGGGGGEGEGEMNVVEVVLVVEGGGVVVPVGSKLKRGSPNRKLEPDPSWGV